MPDEINQLILAELRALRSDFQSFRNDAGERLAILETDNHAVMGNGQPGRITCLERSVDDLKQWRWRIAGISTAIGAALSVAIELILARFK